ATSLSVDAAVCLIGTTEDNTSGAQKIGCSRNDLCGLWAKAETPPPPEFGTCFGIVPSGYHCPVVALIGLIAAKEFPGDVGNVSVLQTLIGVRRSPVELKHCSAPYRYAMRIAAQ